MKVFQPIDIPVAKLRVALFLRLCYRPEMPMDPENNFMFEHFSNTGKSFEQILIGIEYSICKQNFLLGKMPGDAKLETADELLEVYNNPEKLKAYKYTQPIVSTKGINNEKFHMDLPYQEIK